MQATGPRASGSTGPARRRRTELTWSAAARVARTGQKGPADRAGRSPLPGRRRRRLITRLLAAATPTTGRAPIDRPVGTARPLKKGCRALSRSAAATERTQSRAALRQGPVTVLRCRNGRRQGLLSGGHGEKEAESCRAPFSFPRNISSRQLSRVAGQCAVSAIMSCLYSIRLQHLNVAYFDKTKAWGKKTLYDMLYVSKMKKIIPNKKGKKKREKKENEEGGKPCDEKQENYMSEM